MLIASFLNLAGPDLLIIAIILMVVVGLPAIIALPNLFVLMRRRKNSPPLPPSQLSLQLLASADPVN